MKLELFYVVRPYSSSNDRVGRSADCDYFAGPFKSWNQAFDVKRDQVFSDNYDVVKQVVEVEL